MIRLLPSALLLVGCAGQIDPCSPRAVAVVDALCAETVVQVMSEACPDAESVSECPEGMAALTGCDMAIERHAVECAR